MSSLPPPATEERLAGVRVALVGRLVSMAHGEAEQLIRQHGGTLVDAHDPSAQLIVRGDNASDRAMGPTPATVIGESELWQRLDLVETQQHVHRLYTSAMLANLVSVPLATVRRWHRRGLITPVRQVRRLAYFDFESVTAARRLVELLASGLSPAMIERKLVELGRLFPEVKRPLIELSIVIEGRRLLVRQGEELIEPGGQLRFDFEAADSAAPNFEVVSPPSGDLPQTPAELLELAAQLDEAGQLEAAIEMHRAALAAGGPRADVCFALAELLYRQGDLSAAAERYYMAIELDEDYVEARANLGCVLAETGRRELAVAAFEGALAYHGDYPDVHYHLARTLDELGRGAEAEAHWTAFLDLAPDSPWAADARQRLGV